MAVAVTPRSPEKQDRLSSWVARVEEVKQRHQEESADYDEQQQLVSEDILANFPVLNHFMPVLLSLQCLGVARTDENSTPRCQHFMRTWRFVIWTILALYIAIVMYSYLAKEESSLVRNMTQLELTDATLLFIAAVISNIGHNFHRASFFEVVQSLNELATKGQLQKQSEAEELRCFLLSLLNWLCHCAGAIVYVLYNSEGVDIFETSETIIRMLLISTMFWAQVISASEMCWSFAHFVREINRLLMKRVSLRLLLDMRVRYSRMVTTVREVNRLYSFSLGVAFIHAITRSSLTLRLFLRQYEHEISATLWMWTAYEVVMFGCLITMSEASNSLRINGIETATLVSERISEFRDAPQQMSLIIRSLKRNTLQLNIFGLIPLSRAFCALYMSVIITGAIIYVVQDKNMLSLMADTTSL